MALVQRGNSEGTFCPHGLVDKLCVCETEREREGMKETANKLYLKL